MHNAHPEKLRTNDPAANPDPITKAPGSHPIGTGIGAAAGGVAGASGAITAGVLLGTVAGPLGTAVGAAVGAVAGAIVGKEVAEGINPSVEHDYWRKHYTSRPYTIPGASYDEYGPAYQYGWESRSRNTATNFEDVETALSQDWDHSKGKSNLNWDQAKAAARDAWERNTARTESKG